LLWPWHGRYWARVESQVARAGLHRSEEFLLQSTQIEDAPDAVELAPIASDIVLKM
jgi:hypothetical protein